MYYTTQELIEYEDHSWYVTCTWDVEPYEPGNWWHAATGGQCELVQAIDVYGNDWTRAWSHFYLNTVAQCSRAAYEECLKDGEDRQADRQIEALDATREGDWDEEYNRTNVWKGK